MLFHPSPYQIGNRHTIRFAEVFYRNNEIQVLGECSDRMYSCVLPKQYHTHRLKYFRWTPKLDQNIGGVCSKQTASHVRD